MDHKDYPLIFYLYDTRRESWRIGHGLLLAGSWISAMGDWRTYVQDNQRKLDRITVNMDVMQGKLCIET